jgi:hypothetical protein
MSSLSSFRTFVLSLLDDSALARYTNTQVDAALRQALAAYQSARPLVRTYSVDGTGDYQIVMPDDFDAIAVTEVYLDNTDNPPTPLTFYAFLKDEQWVIQTTQHLVLATESILVTYSLPHSIDDLDDAAGTTIPYEDEQAVAIGAAGYAALSRAVKLVETVNVEKSAWSALLKLGTEYLTRFAKLIRPKTTATFTQEPDLKTDVF